MYFSDEREVKPLGVIAHGQRHKPRANQRQRYKPRTCQSMLNTLQVTGWLVSLDLAAPTPTHPQPPNGVPPCLVWRICFGRGEGWLCYGKSSSWKRPGDQKVCLSGFLLINKIMSESSSYWPVSNSHWHESITPTLIDHSLEYCVCKQILCSPKKKNQWWRMDFSNPILTVTPIFWHVVCPSIITSKAYECARD